MVGVIRVGIGDEAMMDVNGGDMASGGGGNPSIDNVEDIKKPPNE